MVKIPDTKIFSLTKGVSPSLNLYCIILYNSLYLFVVIIKQLSKQLIFWGVFFSFVFSLDPMFSSPLNSFIKKKNLLETYMLKRRRRKKRRGRGRRERRRE